MRVRHAVSDRLDCAAILRNVQASPRQRQDLISSQTAFSASQMHSVDS